MTGLEVTDVLAELRRAKASEGTLIARAIEAIEWLLRELDDLQTEFDNWDYSD